MPHILKKKKKTFEKTFTITFNQILAVVAIAFAALSIYLWDQNRILQFEVTASANNSNNVVTNKAAASTPTPTPAPTEPVKAVGSIESGEHIKGNVDAPIKLIEYSDLECPYCKRHHDTMKQLLADYGDKVAWVYRQYPLPIHTNAQKESEASECVAEIGGNDLFWKYIDLITERTTATGTGFALDKLAPLAEEIGVDKAKFTSCLDSGKYADKVTQQTTEGTSAGVRGTPGTFIVKSDGTSTLISGALPLESIKASIDKAL